MNGTVSGIQCGSISIFWMNASKRLNQIDEGGNVSVGFGNMLFVGVLHEEFKGCTQSKTVWSTQS